MRRTRLRVSLPPVSAAVAAASAGHVIASRTVTPGLSPLVFGAVQDRVSALCEPRTLVSSPQGKKKKNKTGWSIRLHAPRDSDCGVSGTNTVMAESDGQKYMPPSEQARRAQLDVSYDP
jgi:hypothetical protein